MALSLPDCECEDFDESCDACCLMEDNVTCVSTIQIAEENIDGLRDLLPNGMGRSRPIGFPCGGFTGYCDFFNQCMIVDSEGALERLANILFDSDALSELAEDIEEMWWAVVLVAVGVIVIMFVVVLTVHLLLPRPEHAKQRAQRRKTLRRSRKQRGQGGVEMHNPSYPYSSRP